MILSLLNVLAAVLFCVLLALVGGWLLSKALRNHATSLQRDGWLVLRQGLPPVFFDNEMDMLCYLTRINGRIQVLTFQNGELSDCPHPLGKCHKKNGAMLKMELEPWAGV